MLKLKTKTMDIDTKYRSLTKSELHLMNILWDMERATINELLQAMPEPVSAYTTILTVMRVLTQKKIVKTEQQGKAHVYIPIMSREDYTQGFMEETRNTLFKGSFKSLLSFFAQRETLSNSEIDELISLLNKSKK
jgi:predicted transcriptional regulator